MAKPSKKYTFTDIRFLHENKKDELEQIINNLQMLLAEGWSVQYSLSKVGLNYKSESFSFLLDVSPRFKYLIQRYTKRFDNKSMMTLLNNQIQLSKQQ
jgi:hypothetical protein